MWCLSPFSAGFPAFHGGILDHIEPRIERLRAVYGGDGGSGSHDDDAGSRRVVHFVEVRPGRLVASS